MGGIVVGVDGSVDSLRALRWALEESVLRTTPLTVLAAHEPVQMTPAWTPDTVYVEIPQESLEAYQASIDGLVDKAVADWGGERPAGLTVRAEPGGARDLLLRAAQGADMVVVGSRGASAVSRLLLGSVSSAVAHHATCPVVVVPPPVREEPDS